MMGAPKAKRGPSKGPAPAAAPAPAAPAVPANKKKKVRETRRRDSFRVRIGIGHTDDGRFCVDVRVDRRHYCAPEIVYKYKSEPYATEAQAELHRTAITAGVSAWLAQLDLKRLGVSPVSES